MKKIIGILILAITMMGCAQKETSLPSAEQQQVNQTNAALNEMNRQVGMPNINNFFEKKMAKQIFELRDNAELVTYAYSQTLEGHYVYIGKCIGYGLPYSVQYTNPQKMGSLSGGGSSGGYYNNPYVIDQADPNGLYMPSGLSATWLMIINEETGEIEPAYEEREITVRQSKIPAKQCLAYTLPSNY